jgi:hypothetical protein
MTEVQTFTCHICNDASTDICVYCTKDACANHLCKKCGHCSDCCDCEVALTEEQVAPHCHVCGQAAAEHCVECRKDVCADHRCLRCLRCSDCCECEMPLSESEGALEAASIPAAPETPEPISFEAPGPDREPGPSQQDGTLQR